MCDNLTRSLRYMRIYMDLYSCMNIFLTLFNILKIDIDLWLYRGKGRYVRLIN
jgi:hypothetical protein